MQLSLYMFMHSCSGVVAANVHCEGGACCLLVVYMHTVYV